MYTNHWGMDRSPFAAQLNAADYFPSATHEEGLARLQFLVDNGRRLGFLQGTNGTGKSLLFEVAARKFRSKGCCIVRSNLMGLSGPEFVWNLASALGHLVSTSAAPVDCWRGISDRLAANRYQRITTLVLLDDAEDCDESVYSAICRLALKEQHPDSRLTIVLACQPQRSASFGTKLNEMCDMKIDVEPWEVDDTAAYIRDALARVGAPDETFNVMALQRLHELTHGIPRRVRQLAELSLVAGAADGITTIDPDIVEAVHRSLAGQDISEAA